MDFCSRMLTLEYDVKDHKNLSCLPLSPKEIRCCHQILEPYPDALGDGIVCLNKSGKVLLYINRISAIFRKRHIK